MLNNNSENSKYCTCGEEFDSTDKFCINCGKPRIERKFLNKKITNNSVIDLDHCPYCHEDLEIGYISSATPAMWRYPNTSTTFNSQNEFNSNLQEELESLNNFSAKRCNNCNVIIIPY